MLPKNQKIGNKNNLKGLNKDQLIFTIKQLKNQKINQKKLKVRLIGKNNNLKN